MQSLLLLLQLKLIAAIKLQLNWFIQTPLHVGKEVPEVEKLQL